jgi:Carboxypeptidase regulatory-like domain
MANARKAKSNPKRKAKNERSSKRHNGRVFLFYFLILCLPSAIFGQMNTADITGSITDPTGALVPRATVTALQVATQQKHTATSNGAGQYRLAQLPLGEYKFTVDARGFKQTVQDGVVLHAGDHIRQDFSLDVGESSQSVMVEARAGLMQVESADIKDVIDNQQMLSLPLKDRQFLELAILSPGVVNPPGGTRGDSLQQTGKLINVLGNRTGHNLFLVDGVSVTDEYFNNVALSPSPDATREFNMELTDYGAEFGGKSGGVVNVITRSGTNGFHGSVYEFVRNDVFDAQNYFAPPNVPAPFRENQFLKCRIFARKARTKFLLKFVRDISAKMTLSFFRASVSVRDLTAIAIK